MKPVVMTEARCKEEDEDMQQKAPTPQQQLNSDSKPVSVPNFNMVVLPAQNQVIDAMGNKYFFVDSSGNPVSPVLQIPIPVGQTPMIQDASEGVQLLMLNPNQAPSSISNSCAAVNGKGSAVTPKKPVQLSATGPTDEVIYVHPKQYERILIRRMQRRRLEEQGKIPSNGERKKYLHESRHLHAKNRWRKSGGRFGGSPFQESKG